MAGILIPSLTAIPQEKTACDCPEPPTEGDGRFFCARHRCGKTRHFRKLCQTNPGYWAEWEAGRGPRTDEKRAVRAQEIPDELRLGFTLPELASVDIHLTREADPKIWSGEHLGVRGILAYIEQEESFLLTLLGAVQSIGQLKPNVARLDLPLIWFRFELHEKTKRDGELIRAPEGWKPDRFGGSPYCAGLTV